MTGQLVSIIVLLSPPTVFYYRQWTLTLCGWEGNCKSGIILVLCERLQCNYL